jgi:hypothetical protein
MPKPDLTYYAGRLNLMPVQSDRAQKVELVRAALGAAVTVHRAGYEWTFLNINALQHDGREFFSGFLVKFKPESQEEIARLDTRTLQVAIARDLVQSKARFFIEVETGLIFYHPSIPEIPRDVFETRFSQLFEKGLGNFFIDAQIDPIREQFSILQEIERFEAILQVDITLRPSNPDHSEMWANQDEKLKRRRARWARETLAGSETNGGLNIKDDPEIRSSFCMAEDGYGEAYVRGIRGGKKRSISTRNAQIKYRAPNDDEEAALVLAVLIEGLTEVLRRLFEDS